MTTGTHHLAQLNVGRMLAPVDAPEIADFMANLERINQLADGSSGFVWRLQTEEGDATSIRPFEDDLMLVNLSVWESIDTLRAFTYTSAHVGILRRRREWFERLPNAHLVLWWIEAGHIPTVTEAIDRLERLRREGPTPLAFTFRTPFTATGAPGEPLVDAEFCWPELAAG